MDKDDDSLHSGVPYHFNESKLRCNGWLWLFAALILIILKRAVSLISISMMAPSHYPDVSSIGGYRSCNMKYPTRLVYVLSYVT